MDEVSAPLRREAERVAAAAAAGQGNGSASGERTVTVAELLAFDPDDPDNDLDAYIV
jgi:hypothetical protein